MLYSNLQKDLYNEFLIQAKMHGATVGEEETQTGTQQTKPKQQPLFPDPGMYKDMSDEEKKELTKRLMAKHMIITKDFM